MRPLQNILYVLTPDSYLFWENECIGVRVGGEEKVRVPAHTIESILCFGSMTVSTPLIRFCGQRGIALSFLSENGQRKHPAAPPAVSVGQRSAGLHGLCGRFFVRKAAE